MDELVILRRDEVQEIVENAVARVIDGTDGVRYESEWYTLKRACQLTGINYNTCKSIRRYQPKEGIEDGMLAGRRVWHRETVKAWQAQLDS